MNSTTKEKMISVVLLFISLAFFIIGIITKLPEVLLISIMFIYIIGFIFSLSNIYENIALFLFLLSTIVFLFGRIIAQDIFGYTEYGFGIYQTNVTDQNILLKFYKLIYLSILSIITGYKIFMSKSTIKLVRKTEILNSNYEKILMWICKITFYFLIFFRVLVLVERISYVNENSYFDSFDNYNSSYPLFLVRLSQSYAVPFFILLSLKLKKKKIIFPIMIFLAEGVVSLFTGRRMNFILNIIIISIYFIHDDYRNNYKKNKWINKWTSTLGIISIPLLIVISNSIFALRSEAEVRITSLANIFGEFFYKQGVTLSTILHSFIYDKNFNGNSYFTVGPIINFLNNNVITRFFFDTEQINGQTVETGLSSPLFGHRISYFIDSNAYLGGRGYGSSYLAESYVDFGVLGVILISILIGYLLCLLYKHLDKKIFISTFSYMLLMNIMVLPRTETTSFITNSLTINNLVMYIVIVICAKILYQTFEYKYV